ncbi:MAG: lipid-binding protein [Puia sp.]|nr:lipid-binding protein [Puia sp.]
MKKLIFVAIMMAGLFAMSCKRTLPDQGTTATVKMSNGWWVTYSLGGVSLLGDPVFMSTYNTAGNTADSMWVDDLGKFWDFKGVVGVDYKALTFSNPMCINDYYGDTAKIANGKVLLKAGHSRAGNVTDSIYFEIQYSDDDTNMVAAPYFNTYIVSGTARTGFIEDDY